MDSNCAFCKMIAAKVPLYGQGNNFVCYLDAHPVSPGHMLIIPNRHVMKLTELKVTEWLELKRLMKAFASPFVWHTKKQWQDRYAEIRARKVSEQSLWFIDQALTHPQLGKQPDGFNHVVNEGEAAGQTVMHLHWHIIPRYKGDVEDPTGGGRHVIPRMGNYKKPLNAKPAT